MSVADNIIFDPSADELAVADTLLALSVAASTAGDGDQLRLMAVRSIDPLSRLTTPGVPNSMNSATGGVAPASKQEALAMREGVDADKVWRPPRGGVKRGLVGRMIKAVVGVGGVGFEVLDGLKAVEA